MSILDAGPAWFALVALLIFGTTARLTRLVTADSITDPARDWIEAKAKAKLGKGAWAKFDDLVSCPWCVSVWVGFATSFIVLWSWTNRFVLASMIALTASLFTGNLQTREPD